MDQSNLNKYIYMIAKILVLFGAINTALYKYNSDYNILGFLVKDVQSIKYIYILIGLLAVYLIGHRETFLPFLGEAAVPFRLFNQKNNNSEEVLLDPESKLIKLKIHSPNAEKIIWWAADPTESINNEPIQAYNEYENSGVSNVQSDGYAYITFPCPQQYNVGMMPLKKHLHYRETHGGMLSEVKTIYLDC